VAGWIGRLSAEKGPDLFLDALSRSPSWTGSVIGDGSMRAALAASPLARGLAARLHWHGELPEAASYLGAYDAIVLSSRTEGTPIVLLEAMAAGVSIVAARVGGIPNVVGALEAFLVPPENPTAIAQALAEIAGNRDAAATRVAAARERLRSQFSPEAWLDGYEALYRTLGAKAR
jgi:glycosyltransferase involved in cell wall biosynthesis